MVLLDECYMIIVEVDVELGSGSSIGFIGGVDSGNLVVFMYLS